MKASTGRWKLAHPGLGPSGVGESDFLEAISKEMQFAWPVDGPISRDFYYKSSIYVGGQHAAIDIPAAIGTPFRSVADGTVASVGWDFYSGHFIAVDHDGGWRSIYRHLNDNQVLDEGEEVGQGQVVGYSGNTGYTTGPHLHFDLWNRSKVRDDNAIFYKNAWYAVDPELYLGLEDDMPTLDEIVDALKPAIKAEARAAIVEEGGRIRTWCEEAIRNNGGNFRGWAREGCIQAGSGATTDEIKEAMKEAQREGTG